MNRNPSPETRFKKGDERAREAGRKGGSKSGEARRRLRTFRELDEDTSTEKERLKMLDALKRSAMRGNLRAFVIYRDTMGMSPNGEACEEIAADDGGFLAALTGSAAEDWKDEEETETDDL